MFIIWGTSNKAKHVESGQFFCPGCRRPSAYELFRVVRRFELFFIPLFETKVVGEQVVCGGCGGTFDVKVLDYTPQQIKASLNRKTTDWRCSACGDSNPKGIQVCRTCQTERPAEALDLVEFLPVPLDRSGASTKSALVPPPVTSRSRPQAKTSNLALISMIVGLISPVMACLCFTSFLTAPAAIIMGHLARGQIRRSKGALIGGGMANIGLIAGYLTLPLTVLWMLFTFRDSDRGKELAKTPGAAQFQLAEKAIGSDGDGMGHGNTPEARALAEEYSAIMDEIHDTGFKRRGIDLKLRGDYVTWCELQDGRCAFLVHVPEYRKFASDAKESLAELAWLAAQAAVKETLEPGDELAVGLKGDILWGDIMVGSTVAAESIEDNSPDKTTSSEQVLYPFFAVGALPGVGNPAEPAVEEQGDPPAEAPEADRRNARAPPINPIDPVTGVPLVPMSPYPGVPVDPTRPPGLVPIGAPPPGFQPIVPPPPGFQPIVPPPGLVPFAPSDPPGSDADDAPRVEPESPVPAAVDAPRDSGDDGRAERDARRRERLAATRDPETLAEALQRIDAKDPSVRRRGMTYLQKHPPAEPNQEVADKVLAILKDDKEIDAYATSKAIEVWATPEQLPELEKLLDHENILVRERIVNAISGFKTSEAAKALAGRLSDSEQRFMLIPRLQQMGEVAEEHVLKKLRDRDIATRQYVCDILAEIGTSKSVRPLNNMKNDSDVSVRMAAEDAEQKIRARLKSK